MDKNSKNRKAKFKISVGVDEQGAPVSEAKAEATPRAPETKGHFMIVTLDGMKELESLYAHGDMGRVHFFLMKNISKQTGCIHFTQTQIAKEMGVDKALISRGIKQLLQNGIIRKSKHNNAPVFVMKPEVNRGTKRGIKLWNEAENFHQKETEQEAQRLIQRVRELISKGEETDAAVKIVLAKVKSDDLRREVEFNFIPDWDD